jgi:hypothetical protein
MAYTPVKFNTPVEFTCGHWGMVASPSVSDPAGVYHKIYREIGYPPRIEQSCVKCQKKAANDKVQSK